MTLEQLDEFVFKITNEASELIDGAGTTKGVESVTRSVLQCMYLEALKDVLNIAKIDIHNGIDDKYIQGNLVRGIKPDPRKAIDMY